MNEDDDDDDELPILPPLVVAADNCLLRFVAIANAAAAVISWFADDPYDATEFKLWLSLFVVVVVVEQLAGVVEIPFPDVDVDDNDSMVGNKPYDDDDDDEWWWWFFIDVPLIDAADADEV